MSTFTIDLHDRPGSLERFLNRCRRKGWDVAELAFGPGDGPGIKRLVVTFSGTLPATDHLIAQLAKVYDVVAITPAAAAKRATAAA